MSGRGLRKVLKCSDGALKGTAACRRTFTSSSRCQKHGKDPITLGIEKYARNTSFYPGSPMNHLAATRCSVISQLLYGVQLHRTALIAS